MARTASKAVETVADGDHQADAGRAGAVDHRLPVLVELGRVQVDVAVDQHGASGRCLQPADGRDQERSPRSRFTASTRRGSAIRSTPGLGQAQAETALRGPRAAPGRPAARRRGRTASCPPRRGSCRPAPQVAAASLAGRRAQHLARRHRRAPGRPLPPAARRGPARRRPWPGGEPPSPSSSAGLLHHEARAAAAGSGGSKARRRQRERMVGSSAPGRRG